MPETREPVDFEPVPAGNCTCCEMTLRMAMSMLGPAFTYDLSVSPLEFLDEIARVRSLTAAPLAFHFNIYKDDRLERSAWHLSTQGSTRKVGSRGPF